MEKINSRALQQSFLIALAYVGLGTISVLSLYPSDVLYGAWVTPGVFITLPVNFVSVAIRYADSTASDLLVVVQAGYFLLCWGISYRLMNKKK